MKMGKMKSLLCFLIMAMILLSVVTSVQAATISGSSTRRFLGECGTGLSITFTSDDPNSRLTKAVIDISSKGGPFGPGLCAGWGVKPEDPAFKPTFSGWGTSVLTIDFTGFKPGMTFGVNLHDYTSFYWDGPTIEVTVTADSSECTFTGTYAGTHVPGDFDSIANFGGTCPPTAVFLSLAPVSDTNLVGTSHTLTATLEDETGAGIPGETITFTVTAGPHAGTTGTDVTDANGKATWSYTGTTAGKDTIVATGAGKTSNEAFKTWEATAVELCPDKYRWGSGGWKWDPFPKIFVGRQEVHFVNKGTVDVYDVTARVTCVPKNVVATDPDVTLGDIPAGGSAWSSDTFELRVDMTNPQGPAKGICWQVEYDDAAGVHHVIEDVAKYCGEECSDICP